MALSTISKLVSKYIYKQTSNMGSADLFNRLSYCLNTTEIALSTIHVYFYQGYTQMGVYAWIITYVDCTTTAGIELSSAPNMTAKTMVGISYIRMSGPDKDFSRNVVCTLNSISTFLLLSMGR